MDSKSDNANRHDPSTPPTARAVPLGVFFSRALSLGIQGQRKPRWRPLVARPRRLLPRDDVTAAGDRPFLRRKRVGTLSGGLPFSPAENRKIGAIGIKWSRGEEEGVKQKEMDYRGSPPSVLIVRRRPTVGLHDHM